MGTIKGLLDIARAELGTAEYPPGSNRVKYNTWYYGRAVSGDSYPWCMAFVQWCCRQAGAGLPVKTASCGALMRAAKRAGCWVTENLRPGDAVIYDFPGGAATDHCGIVESVDKSAVTAIEGNTSERGSQSNGGMVCRKKRPYSQIVGAVRPDFGEDEDMTREEIEKLVGETLREVLTEALPEYRTLAEVPEWYRPSVQKLCDRGALRGRGEDLALSEDLCRTLTILDRLGTFS